MPVSPLPDVVTPAELAHAAGVSRSAVDAALSHGGVRRLPGGYLAWAEAIRLGRQLRVAAAADGAHVPAHDVPVLESEPLTDSERGVPLALSSSLHAAGILMAVLLSSTGALSTPAQRDETVMPARLVYLPLPGPGGGGGGGGLKQPTPPPAVKRQGIHQMRSPVPPPPPAVEPKPEPPRATPPPEPIKAPVASLPSDQESRAGVIESAEPPTDSHGSGTGGGAGTGTGTGMGEGSGNGIGPGTGGGTGGGVYHPGSGIDPPRLLREVKADYTEDARRRGISGEAVFEIVVRADGSVGEIRMLQGLGYGLDQRAIDALRQWRFAPATLKGTPVNVLVEVSVEFRWR